MILWFILFVIIVAISFVLAYQSMQDYQQKADIPGVENTLYLVRHPAGLTSQVIDLLHNQTVATGQIISIERLFKGNRSATVIFGPKSILQNLTQQLHLLELEDYSNINSNSIVGWEFGVKDPLTFHTSKQQSLFEKMPNLENTEQFWCQVVLQAKPENWLSKFLTNKEPMKDQFLRWIGFPGTVKTYDLVMNKTLLSDQNVRSILTAKSTQKAFQAQIRCILLTPDENKRRSLASSLENMPTGSVVKIPRPITSQQQLTLYKSRTLPLNSEGSFLLTTQEIKELILPS